MISTHILDTSRGVPAEGVNVRLEFLDGATWAGIATVTTNADGRAQFQADKKAGTYRLTFLIDDYYKREGRQTFFVEVPVLFSVVDLNRKYHVPLLLNPFGFSVYRGS